MVERLQPLAEQDVLHIDSTAIKCRRTTNGVRGWGEEAIGRSGGGLTTKVHHAVYDLGFVRRLLTSPSQHADCHPVELLTAGLEPVAMVGDKRYNSDKQADNASPGVARRVFTRAASRDECMERSPVTVMGGVKLAAQSTSIGVCRRAAWKYLANLDALDSSDRFRV